MQLVNEFRVPVSIGKAWEVLTDVERIVPCIPGAELRSVRGDEFTGVVKVKVGPITVQYTGDASFQDKDASAHRAVIKADGKETRGQGNASAVVTAELKDEGDHTLCVITTDLTISGKAAQFGRGVLTDVSSHLIEQFAKNLEADLLGGSSETPLLSAVTSSTANEPVSEASHDNTINSLALAKAIFPSLAKRYAPVIVALTAGTAVGFLLGHRGRHRVRNQPSTDDLLAVLSRLLP